MSSGGCLRSRWSPVFLSYVTNESNALFGQPSFNRDIAYWPRVLQLGVRLAL